MPYVNHWEHWSERLRSGYVVTENGCHEWVRSRNNKGYGLIWFDGRLHLAHRAVWLLTYGEWPTTGLVVDHICNNPACIRIDHLRLLTNGANIQRAYPRGDAATEHRRAGWRAANARRRAKGGGRNSVV